MARRLPDGSIQMADGRIVYGDTFLNTQDFVELLPLFVPAPGWPFVSGGGGGGAGTPGARGADGAPGLQGPQGTNPGVQGPQGFFGTQGAQGNQGTSGSQGNQGNQGVSGPQGFQGIVGPQGISPDTMGAQFGSNNAVGAGGTLQLEGPGTTLVGITAIRAGTISGGSITVNAASANDYDLDIRVNGVSVATVPLPAGSTSAFSSALAVPVVAGDIITVFLVRTSGSGGSGFNNEQALIEISS